MVIKIFFSPPRVSFFPKADFPFKKLFLELKNVAVLLWMGEMLGGASHLVREVLECVPQSRAGVLLGSLKELVR